MTMFHTYDVFNVNDLKLRKEYYDFCHKKALECDLSCKCLMKDNIPYKLELWGSKWQFLKYYLVTLTKCRYKMKGIKRLISFIFE